MPSGWVIVIPSMVKMALMLSIRSVGPPVPVPDAAAASPASPAAAGFAVILFAIVLEFWRACRFVTVSTSQWCCGSLQRAVFLLQLSLYPDISILVKPIFVVLFFPNSVVLFRPISVVLISPISVVLICPISAVLLRLIFAMLLRPIYIMILCPIYDVLLRPISIVLLCPIYFVLFSSNIICTAHSPVGLLNQSNNSSRATREENLMVEFNS